jgi:hypothetical protein
MTVKGDYMGMALSIDDLDGENIEYFKHCAEHRFHLQKCDEGKGAVYSYLEVHHAIQPAFKAKTPYMVLLVELDTQQGKPTPDDGLRVVANLTLPNGEFAPPDVVKSIGIGTRVRMVFSDVSDGLALPQWAIDEAATQPAKPWRYPQE